MARRQIAVNPCYIMSSRPSEARAGTHNHRCIELYTAGAAIRSNYEVLWLWVPAFAGTTREGGLTPPAPTVRRPGWSRGHRGRGRAAGIPGIRVRAAARRHG